LQKVSPLVHVESLTVPSLFGRPAYHCQQLASFVDEASRLRAFVPPFQFTSFFSPEDTLLCMCAAETALAYARKPGNNGRLSRDALRVAELTTGSGLVGIHLLRIEHGSTLLAFDVDQVAVDTARSNARTLGLKSRSRFDCVDLWSDSTATTLAAYKPHLIVCNPPYVPEPENGKLEPEAGAGEDGTAHLMRTIELADQVRPRAMALSWCSLSDPGRIVREAEAAGYFLNSLFVVAIADGEYSRSVQRHLHGLPHAYINESEDVRRAVAPDGSACFGYLLISGEFSRFGGRVWRTSGSSAAVERICREFAAKGIDALVNPVAPVPVRTWILDRWDEMRLRASLYGEIESVAAFTA
jgi:methylase of polypeptide subunit release factors